MNGYFDHNATSPMTAAARDEWLRVETSHWHNPSSLYREAGIAKRLLEDLREEVADRLGCDEPERVVFTSGATEANNAVMRFAAQSYGKDKVMICPTEHPSVVEAAQAEFDEVHLMGVEQPEEIISGRLVSAMAANNETGSLSPWQELASKFRSAGARYHCDAAQWIGKRQAKSLAECDFVTVSGHKFGGPKAVGAMLIPADAGTDSRNSFVSLLGGPQENRHRAGTENLPGIAAMVVAWRQREQQIGEQGFIAARAAERDAFEVKILEKIGASEIVAGKHDRLWNTSMLIVPAHSNLKWLTRLCRRGFCISTGSACSAGKGNPSHVMQAMGLDHDQMGRVLRISGGWETTGEDWRSMASALIEVWRELESGERPKVF